MSQTLQRLSLTFVILLGMNPLSRGALIPTATLVKDPSAGSNFGAPDAALPAGWVSYQLSLNATAGEKVGAVDVSITGGVLHQRWTDVDFDGTTDPTPNGAASDGRGDSHLTAPAGSPFGSGPTETNSKTGSPLTSNPGSTEYGLGNLSGAWAILNPTATTNLAYLVFKKSDQSKINITVKSADPLGNSFPTFNTQNFGGPLCLACVPVITDETIDNVNASVPGFLHHQLQISNQAPGQPYFFDVTNFKLDSYVPGPGASGTGPATAPTIEMADASTYYFDWNTVGSPLGTYKWTFTASNFLGGDDGSLTIRITAVPEPASVALVLLGIMAVVSNRGRR